MNIKSNSCYGIRNNIIENALTYEWFEAWSEETGSSEGVLTGESIGAWDSKFFIVTPKKE